VHDSSWKKMLVVKNKVINEFISMKTLAHQYRSSNRVIILRSLCSEYDLRYITHTTKTERQIYLSLQNINIIF
jgi:hypothetical protein